jgi:hypothetical protein
MAPEPEGSSPYSQEPTTGPVGSKQLFNLQCSDRLKHEHPIITGKFRCHENGQGRNFYATTTKNFPVRALSYKAVCSIHATK